MASLFREAVARAQDFLLEPPAVEPAGCSRALSQIEVAVLGLSAGCGVTTLARGLALWLQVPRERPSHMLAIGDDADVRLAVAPLAARPSALVWDISTGAGQARVAARRADVVVLVAGAGSEPALAEVAAHMLREDFERLLLVANRVTDESRWNGRPDLCVPESRIGAAFLRRGQRPAGAFGSAIERLAALVEELRGRRSP